MARQALGKGLSGLIPAQLRGMDPGAGEGPVAEIPVSQVRPNRFQPRKVFPAHELKELADSIREQGVLQPVLVRRDGREYELISGERRFRAVQMLGLRVIPAVVKADVSDEKMAEWALIENIQRQDLNPLEEAQAFRRLLEEFKLSQEEMARKVGKDRATVANILRLLKLPEEVQGLVRGGKLSMGHARALLSLERAESQKALAHRAVREGWSVRQVEKACGPSQHSRARAKGAVRPDVNLSAAEEELRRLLATKVRIRPGRKGGCIEVEYYNNEDLERILDTLKSGRGK